MKSEAFCYAGQTPCRFECKQRVVFKKKDTNVFNSHVGFCIRDGVNGGTENSVAVMSLALSQQCVLLNRKEPETKASKHPNSSEEEVIIP